jgi:hypothetical protein
MSRSDPIIWLLCLLCEVSLTFVGFSFEMKAGTVVPSQFNIIRSPYGLSSLRRVGDSSGLEFIRSNSVLGTILMRVRTGDGTWQTITNSEAGVVLRSEFVPDGEALRWEVTVKNTRTSSLEVGDLELPLPMNDRYTVDNQETAVQRVFKHAFIAGSGTFLYWLPVKGTGSFLVMLPRKGTSLEFFKSNKSSYGFGGEDYSVFVHSKAASLLESRGTWRQPRTSRVLEPGAEARYAFDFYWADSYEGVRDALFEHGGVDIYTAPGMVIPRDNEAFVALRTKRHIQSIEAEFPAQTEINTSHASSHDMHVYSSLFHRLGENCLTVHFEDGGTMPLEYFVTLPLETLIKKRASFIARKQQYRDPAKWYDGLFSLWDQRLPAGSNLLGPDNLQGQDPYAVEGSDDPSNGKSLLLAEKNAAYPDAAEIEALDYYLQHFVWGKLQRTDKETPYPYGIYGSDSWKQNRFTDRDPITNGACRAGGPSECRMWRSFDYTTCFALYYDLYRIARQRPDLVHYLNAAGYLERAYGTARAYFEVPANIYMDGGWAHKGWVYWQYTVGNFHEKYLLPLIDALEAEGQHDKADFLRGEWEKKVKYFIYDNPWPFASEMPIDSTAYESTYAAADYALTHDLAPDTNLWCDRNLNKWYSHPVIDPRRNQEFLQRQYAANLACRGVLEANYWSLGSDFRGCGSASYTLSYMSQMGGWAVLDKALRHDAQPAADLRLGYASLLSSWALLNAGDEQSNYGFWTPDERQDGAVGWGFQPRQVGTEWNPATKNLTRGAWPVCGEIDHGLVGAINAARTVVFDDPIFGLLAYGGKVVQNGNTFEVIPRDGVRQRISALVAGHRIHIELDRDGFAFEQPIHMDRDMKHFAFMLENRGDRTQIHETGIRFSGLPSGNYVAKTTKGLQALTVSGDHPIVVETEFRGIPLETVELQMQH